MKQQNKIFNIISGKGGVGKTTVSVNLAISMAKSGKRVLIFDADTSLANIDLYFGIKPKSTILDFVDGKSSLQNIISKVNDNLFIIPSISGISELSELSNTQRFGLKNAIKSLENIFDVIIVDSGSGITNEVTDYIIDDGEIVIVLNNDILSLTDSFATIKAISKKKGKNDFLFIANKMNKNESEKIFNRLFGVCKKFTPSNNLKLLGNIPFSKEFTTTLNKQKPQENRLLLKDRLFLDISNNMIYNDLNNIGKNKVYGEK